MWRVRLLSVLQLSTVVLIRSPISSVIRRLAEVLTNLSYIGLKENFVRAEEDGFDVVTDSS